MQDVEIVSITKEDLIQLQKISRHTFLETFEATNTNENMTAYLEKSFSSSQLLSELNNKNSAFYFAKHKEQIIGYLKLNHGEAQTESVDINTLEIERIYVLKKFYGKAVGQLLLNRAVEVANSLQISSIWLGVWEDNQRAISFYTKNKFIPFDKHSFKLGDDEQIDILMKLELPY
jgi:diamine N-acetyltransferase